VIQFTDGTHGFVFALMRFPEEHTPQVETQQSRGETFISGIGPHVVEDTMKRSLLLVAILLISVSAANAQYKFTSLDFPGGTLTTARGINNRGQIVGAYRTDSTKHALLIKGGKFLPLAPGTLLGSTNSEAYKFNDRGDVVGAFISNDGVTHGFRLGKGVLTTLDYPGANFTRAFGINQSGVVVGEWAVFDDSGNIIAYGGFIWKDCVFTNANFFPGAGVGAPLGINERGDMVGGWSTDLTSPDLHGFVYSGGHFVSFDVPFSGASATQPNDINELGQIVGLYNDADGLNHGFFKVGESFLAIDFPGAATTTAWGINAIGQIVGTHYDYVGAPARGYIATPNTR
jgi:uncharacterized membrane protein